MLGMWWTISLIIGLLSLLWVAYDIAKNQKEMSTGRKILWIIVALLFGLIGAAAYYIVEKRD
ncbi:PLDc N-terminal domain-containing protein [Thermococcus litoralis]|uniref:PLDc N-terminal domain-containing protein n=1 Tax=Thermococcus litoralis TaxID=2265 RepID=UPI000B35AF74|nr:PLDc N-terminal domain-containing protein [Thermococcus litoralis]